MLRYHLLGLLCKSPRHGYALAKEYQHRSGVELSLGGIYRELRHLTREGFVRRVRGPAKEDPRRAPYEITTRGRSAFQEWFHAVPSSRTCDESELAVRVMFFAEVVPADAQSVLEQWRMGLWKLTKSLEVGLEYGIGIGAEATMRTLLVRRRMRHVAAELEFLDELQHAVETHVARDGGRTTALAEYAPALRKSGSKK